jgi:small-conductance mechanosensitive channel
MKSLTFLATELPSDALKYGFIGFGFLLALLGYYSFHQAMRRQVTRSTLIMFFAFLGFSLALSGMGLFAENLKARNDLADVRRRIGDQLQQKNGAIDRLRNQYQLDPQQKALVNDIAATLADADKVLADIQNGK